MHLVRDSVLVYSRLPEEFVIRKYDLKNDALLDELTIEREEDAERGSFEPNMGRIAVNDSYLIFVYQYKDRIDIYDIDDLRLLRRIEGDYKKQVPEPGNEELYYIGAVAGEDRFYVLYKGERIDGKARSNTVEVYDYQGRPIVRYRFAGLPPLYFFPDEQSGFIYGYYPAQADSLLRYKI